MTTSNWKRSPGINKGIQRKSKRGRRKQSISRNSQRKLVKGVSFPGSVKIYIYIYIYIYRIL